jgi:hypothetical protein
MGRDVATDGVVELQQLFVGLLCGSIAALENGTLDVLYCLYIFLLAVLLVLFLSPSHLFLVIDIGMPFVTTTAVCPLTRGWEPVRSKLAYLSLYI